MTNVIKLPAPKIRVRLKETTGGGHVYEVTKNEVQHLELPGVTTPLNIIGGGKTNALMSWAAKLTSLEIIEKVAEKINATKTKKRASITLDWIEKIATAAKSAHRRAKDDAADLGTRVHEYADAVVCGRKLPKVTEDMKPAVESFTNWYKDTKLTFVAGDTAVANPDMGYAGAVDAIAVDEDGGWILIDFKTSSGIREEYALQVAAYAEALWFTYGISVKAAYIVRFDKAKARSAQIKQVKNIGKSLDAYLHAFRLNESMKEKQYV